MRHLPKHHIQIPTALEPLSGTSLKPVLELLRASRRNEPATSENCGLTGEL